MVPRFAVLTLIFVASIEHAQVLADPITGSHCVLGYGSAGDALNSPGEPGSIVCGVAASATGSLPRAAYADASREAIAVAAAPPSLSNDQSTGVAFNLGTFDGKNAVGLSALTVLARDADTAARVSFYANFGASLDTNDTGGKAGIQIRW